MEFSPHVRTQVKNDSALNKGLISIEGLDRFVICVVTEIHLTDGFDMEVGR